jgi:hypothetical protein
LLDRRKYVAAEPVLRDCLAARKETLPDWTTASARSMLGGALLEQGKYGDAEPLLRAGCEGLKKWAWKTPPAEKVRLPEAAGRLARLYAAIGYPEEAAKWRAEAAKYPETAPPPRPADR